MLHSQSSVFQFRDERGLLQSLDFDDLPFTPKRSVIVSNVPVGTIRGGHGHRTGEQFLIALAGQIDVRIYVDQVEQRITLWQGGPGFHLKPGVIAWQIYQTPDSQLLFLASDKFSPDDYIYP